MSSNCLHLLTPSALAAAAAAATAAHRAATSPSLGYPLFAQVMIAEPLRLLPQTLLVATASRLKLHIATVARSMPRLWLSTPPILSMLCSCSALPMDAIVSTSMRIKTGQIAASPIPSHHHPSLSSPQLLFPLSSIESPSP
ncbi:hypothetical protein PaG_01591 [Moesziomyces aphidis]|uniref:Secreted protein n=1 Tax=Moesziomyces aphidis TaxID=84754 RepID=W3VP40_MOEAP|nr:hypothetical protein PaG_01591 [Moesziomyces aphidis]